LFVSVDHCRIRNSSLDIADDARTVDRAHLLAET